MRCVIADDSREIQKIWTATLIHLGHEVIGVGNSGSEAILLCGAIKPDLALLDMSMGEISGHTAAIAIRANGDAKHIIIATSRVAAFDELAKLGLDFISKPVTVKNLARKIDELTKG